MKIRTKTKERLLSEGWYIENGVVRRDDVWWAIPPPMTELLGQTIDVNVTENGCYTNEGWTWAPEMLETKEEQVLRILKEYESRRQGNSNRG